MPQAMRLSDSHLYPMPLEGRIETTTIAKTHSTLYKWNVNQRRGQLDYKNLRRSPIMCMNMHNKLYDNALQKLVMQLAIIFESS